LNDDFQSDRKKVFPWIDILQNCEEKKSKLCVSLLVAENDMRDEIDVWTLCLSVSVNPLTFLLRQLYNYPATK